jgi:hypothetical protein
MVAEEGLPAADAIQLVIQELGEELVPPQQLFA